MTRKQPSARTTIKSAKDLEERVATFLEHKANAAKFKADLAAEKATVEQTYRPVIENEERLAAEAREDVRLWANENRDAVRCQLTVGDGTLRFRTEKVVEWADGYNCQMLLREELGEKKANAFWFIRDSESLNRKRIRERLADAKTDGDRGEILDELSARHIMVRDDERFSIEGAKTEADDE